MFDLPKNIWGTPTKNSAEKVRISQLKRFLLDTDYQAIKYAEGLISEQDYLPLKEQRQLWRNEINSLEHTIIDINN